MRDWHEIITRYYSVVGYNVCHVAMNRKTLDNVMSYMYKYKYDYLYIEPKYNEVYDIDGNPFRWYVEEQIYFCGIQIIIDDSLEDEVIKVW